MLPPPGVEFQLVFQCWHLQTGALFKPFRCKVLLSISNIHAHVWSIEVIQQILGLSCLVFDSTPRSRDGSDMASFIVVTWACDLDLIPTEVGFSILEPVEPFEEAVPPLFLQTSEAIQYKCNLLHY
jgi:hypothetical protein